MIVQEKVEATENQGIGMLGDHGLFVSIFYKLKTALDMELNSDRFLSFLKLLVRWDTHIIYMCIANRLL